MLTLCCSTISRRCSPIQWGEWEQVLRKTSKFFFHLALLSNSHPLLIHYWRIQAILLKRKLSIRLAVAAAIVCRGGKKASRSNRSTSLHLWLFEWWLCGHPLSVYLRTYQTSIYNLVIENEEGSRIKRPCEHFVVVNWIHVCLWNRPCISITADNSEKCSHRRWDDGRDKDEKKTLQLRREGHLNQLMKIECMIFELQFQGNRCSYIESIRI